MHSQHFQLHGALLEHCKLVQGANASDVLQVLEKAIRDWSAKNNGKLPKSLQELDLPAPLDCIVNKARGSEAADRVLRDILTQVHVPL